MPKPIAHSRLRNTFVSLGLLCLSPAFANLSPTPKTDPGTIRPPTDLFLGRGNDLNPEGKAEGRTIVIQGKVSWEDGTPAKGAKIYLWQRDARGRYWEDAFTWGSRANYDPLDFEFRADPNFAYLGIAEVSVEGDYVFRTVQPVRNFGPLSHINLAVVINGESRLFTEIHFPRESANCVGRVTADGNAPSPLLVSPVTKSFTWPGESPQEVTLIDFPLVLEILSP